MLRVADGERRGRRRVEQVGLGLRVVPLVGVALPAVRAAEEEAGLERAARGGVAALELEENSFTRIVPSGKLQVPAVV